MSEISQLARLLSGFDAGNSPQLDYLDVFIADYAFTRFSIRAERRMARDREIWRYRRGGFFRICHSTALILGLGDIDGTDSEPERRRD